MKRVFFVALCGLIMPSFFIPAQARKKAKKSTTVTAVTSNVKDGLFTVEKNGNDWFFIIPDSLLERRFLTTTRQLLQIAENLRESKLMDRQFILKRHQMSGF